MEEIQRKELKNGIACLFYPQLDRNVLIVSVLIKAGSKYDPKNKEGIAHMLEHLITSGSDKYKDPQELAGLILSSGGKYDVHTTKEIVKGEVSVMKDGIKNAFEYLNQVVFNPVINNETVEREKKIIIQELESCHTDNEYLFWEKLEKVSWPKSWKSRSIIGSIQSIKNITTEDIKKFYATYYRPKNIQVVIAGDYQYKVVWDYLKKYFEQNG